ncbi:MerR family transcriptional regulator [Frankia canadensis]|uniref:MerR family transcriptional regulator n=1 Tax=Frankia canadensis TaxID=1836972 RepID=A0A2I2L1I6_9ACTN|nr:MerR family transcriptional regulator [Frankia canadensis]SOU59070.1 MerR family transcriptional regulator [Frankia canadensis]
MSVRMLRHYDAIGLLRPAQVDPSTGYRWYTAAQLTRLNRIVALRGLGFGLQQVQELLGERVGAEELRGMLRLRQAELRAQIAADTARLADIQARLRMIESEAAMSTIEITVKPLPAVRVVELTGVARNMEPLSIGPVIRGLYERLGAALRSAGVTPTGPAIAYYTDPHADGDGENIVVHAALPIGALPADGTPAAAALAGAAVVDLPAVTQVATVVHRGSMDDCLPSYQALARWIEDAGYRTTGPSRELSLACPEDVDGWVTEIQEPIVPV